MKESMRAKANFIGQCLETLYGERQPHKEDHANEDTCGGKASGKGLPLRVPQVGEDNGPTWHKAGWVDGWKVWVGDLPGDIQKQAIGPHCAGCVDLAINNRTLSGAAYAIVTFHDLAAAFKAFEQLAMAKFNHGNGVILWATVKWFRGKPLANV